MRGDMSGERARSPPFKAPFYVRHTAAAVLGASVTAAIKAEPLPRRNVNVPVARGLLFAPAHRGDGYRIVTDNFATFQFHTRFAVAVARCCRRRRCHPRRRRSSIKHAAGRGQLCPRAGDLARPDEDGGRVGRGRSTKLGFLTGKEQSEPRGFTTKVAKYAYGAGNWSVKQVRVPDNSEEGIAAAVTEQEGGSSCRRSSGRRRLTAR